MSVYVTDVTAEREEAADLPARSAQLAISWRTEPTAGHGLLVFTALDLVKTQRNCAPPSPSPSEERAQRTGGSCFCA